MFSNLQSDAFLRKREQMVQSQLRARGIRDERVLNAMMRVPRHEFVGYESQAEAYEDHPLPIGCNQTISQPYIVALMLEYLQISPTDTVLEIGTGTGYQAALLGELAAQVYTIERYMALANSAWDILRRLGYDNVTVLSGDGNLGFLQRAPFDQIIVAAAAQNLPPALFAQLREEGRMIVPVGNEFSQELQLVRKKSGQEIVTALESCRFVPLVSGAPSDEGKNSGR